MSEESEASEEWAESVVSEERGARVVSAVWVAQAELEASVVWAESAASGATVPRSYRQVDAATGATTRLIAAVRRIGIGPPRTGSEAVRVVIR